MIIESNCSSVPESTGLGLYLLLVYLISFLQAWSIWGLSLNNGLVNHWLRAPQSDRLDLYTLPVLLPGHILATLSRSSSKSTSWVIVWIWWIFSPHIFLLIRQDSGTSSTSFSLLHYLLMRASRRSDSCFVFVFFFTSTVEQVGAGSSRSRSGLCVDVNRLL